MADRAGDSFVAARQSFQSTQWSLVLAAGHPSSPNYREALTELCRRYWYPLYAFARRRVGHMEDAKDLTQEFFATLIEKDYLSLVQPERGRFRSFLLTACKHFLSKEWQKDRAQKRGGGRKPIPLDFAAAEARFRIEPADTLSPDAVYERKWAITLLDLVLARLRDEWQEAGKGHLFDRIKAFLTARSTEQSHAAVAGDLGMTPAAVKMAVHRLRNRYRELLRAEIAQTLADPNEVDEEIHSLFRLFGS